MGMEHLEYREAEPAADCLMAQPEIAEALEATAQLSLGLPADTERISPLRPELALDGLKKLRDMLASDDDSSQRRVIIDTKHMVDGQVQARLAAASSESSHKQPAEEPDPSLAAARQAAARRRHEEQLAGYRSAFHQAVAAVCAEHSELDPSGVLELGDSLEFYESPHGGLRVANERRLSLTRHQERFLQDPETLINDLAVVGLTRQEAPKTASGGAAAEAYAGRLDTVLRHSLDKSTYSPEEFTAEAMAKWLELFEELPPHMTLDEFNDYCFDRFDPDRSPRIMTIAQGVPVMSNSLRTVALHRPSELLDRAYHLAERALDPRHITRGIWATYALGGTLEQPNTRGSHIMGLLLAYADPPVQRKALDLVITLETLIGMNNDEPASDLQLPADRISPRRLPFASTGLLTKVLGLNVRWQELGRQYRAHSLTGSAVLAKIQHITAEFKQYAATPEGRAATLYGRLLPYLEAEEARRQQNPGADAGAGEPA